MKYFKNTELAKIYNVSEKTVRNWVQGAADNKLDIQLYQEKDKFFVANTAKNTHYIQELVAKGKKYKNTRGFRVVKPSQEFYDLYSTKQILDIISNLDIYRELPRQYNYFDGGADYWDKYAGRLASEDNPNLLTSTIKLLKINQAYSDDLLDTYGRVNVLDIGVGNALPVKDLLAHLLAEGKLARYIALDISPQMLKIAERNIKEWFGDKVAFEGYEIDINYDRFTDVLSQEYLNTSSGDTVNLVLVLGGTLGNLRSPDAAFKVIHDSMGRNDFLIYSDKLDSETSRRYFDFNPEPSDTRLAPNHRFIFDLLNIDESLYEVEMGFDDHQRQRYIRVRLKVALTIKFKFETGERTLEFNKGEAILLWRAWEVTAMDVVQQLDRNGYYPLHVSQTRDQEYLLAFSQIKSE